MCDCNSYNTLAVTEFYSLFLNISKYIEHIS